MNELTDELIDGRVIMISIETMTQLMEYNRWTGYAYIVTYLGENTVLMSLNITK